MLGDASFHERHPLMTAVITATWVIVALVVGLLGVALVIVGDDHERPVPTPKVDHYDMRADGRLVPVPSPIVELIDRHPHVQHGIASKADLLAEFEAQHETLRGRRDVLESTPLAQSEFDAAVERAQGLAALWFARDRRERDAAELIDRAFPDPSTPKGER